MFTTSQFINVENNHYLDQHPLYLSDNLYNTEIVHYPFTKPIENILFNNDEGKLNWETTLLPDEANLSLLLYLNGHWTILEEIFKNGIYMSDRNFIYPHENGVEKLVI